MAPVNRMKSGCRDNALTAATTFLNVPPESGLILSSLKPDGVAYWAVSDLGAGDLETFARLFRDAPS